MIPLATAEEMRRADRRATERYGVPSLLLMENAGRGAADALERVLGPVEGRRVAVVCGKGNNGGDGFVVARHLLGRGARISAWLVGHADEPTGDAERRKSTHCSLCHRERIRFTLVPRGTQEQGERNQGSDPRRGRHEVQDIGRQMEAALDA